MRRSSGKEDGLRVAAARIMTAQGWGKIINITSMLLLHDGIMMPSYTAAKSGVAGDTRALANDRAGRGLNANGVAHGYSMGAAVFLASTASDYLHDATVPVDGGWMKR